MTELRQERYINPYTDFGFKKLFGTEMNKDLLISFLNALFNGSKGEITDVQYLNGEHLGESVSDRRAIYDVYCQTANGARFIVEMQKAEQAYFKDRSIYYSTFAIREQAPQGKWDYHLEDVYTVGLLNFTFPAGEYPADSYRHEIKLKDVEDNHVFYDKLTFVYLEMPKFTKTEDELETMFDKWMFVLHNLARLMDRPAALQDRIFKKLFEQAEIAKYEEAERRQYYESQKEYWDYTSTMDTALNKGRAEGRAEGLAEGERKGRAEVARNLKQIGMSVADIAKATGISAGDVVTLTATPDEGYHLARLYANQGTVTISPSAEAADQYTFTMPAEDVTVRAQFDEGDITTGVLLNVPEDSEAHNTPIYNLQGQRLRQLQRGINIIGGRKKVNL